MSNAVQCINLTKTFGKAPALDHVNLTIEENKIYGLLGRNGAGKTTLLNILATHSFQTEGTVKIFGEKPYENTKILNRMCFVKESGSYLTQLKVKEILSIASYFYVNWDNSFALNLLEQFDLEEKKKYSALSKGMQSALEIIIGLASRAELTIYDEPYLGLDAASRWLFYDILIKDYAEKPRTIILSTHLIDEVSKIFEKVIILDKGKVILSEEVDNIRNKALYVSGSKAKIDEILVNKNIIHTENVGNASTIAIFDVLSSEERKKLLSEDMEVKQVPLQEFFIYMTANFNKR